MFSDLNMLAKANSSGTKKPSENGGSKGTKGTPIRPIGSPAKRFFRAVIALLVEFPIGWNMSGRGDGVVYQKNGIMRNFVAPTTVHSVATGLARDNFGFWQNAFGTLGQSLQILWNAGSWTYINRYSKPKALSGRSAYSRFNVNLVNTGQTTISSPPVTVLPASNVSAPVLAADDSAHSLTLLYIPSATASEILVFATAPMRPTIFRPKKGAFKMIGVFDATVASPAVLTTEYENIFGLHAVIGVDKKIFVQLVPISATGNAGSMIQIGTQIVA
jgi:hypothetical protein